MSRCMLEALLGRKVLTRNRLVASRGRALTPFLLFELLEDGTYYPVQSYDDKVSQARAALMAAGLSPEQADTVLA